MLNVRQATEQDWEAIKDLCFKYNRRLPSGIGFGSVVVNEENSIVGFAHIEPKIFIDPLVIDEDRKPVEKVRIIDALGNFIGGHLATIGAKTVYYTAEGEEFTNFLEKKFNSELFTEEATYKVKV